MITLTEKTRIAKPDFSPEILLPRRDFVFKNLFGTEKNKDILGGFIQDALHLPDDEVEVLEIRDPQIQPLMYGRKRCILDLLVNTRSGMHVHIEIQLVNRGDTKDRITYYNCKLISNQLATGDTYQLRRAISIVIVDYDLFPGQSKYFSHFSMMDRENHCPFSDKIEYNILELCKIPQEADNTALWKWMNFLKSEKKGDFEKMKASTTDPNLRKAIEELEKLSIDPKMREEYFLYEKALWDEMSFGAAKFQDGCRETNLSNAKEMLLRSMDRQLILDITKLNEADLESIERNLQEEQKPT